MGKMSVFVIALILIHGNINLVQNGKLLRKKVQKTLLQDTPLSDKEQQKIAQNDNKKGYNKYMNPKKKVKAPKKYNDEMVPTGEERKRDDVDITDINIEKANQKKFFVEENPNEKQKNIVEEKANEKQKDIVEENDNSDLLP